VPSVLKSFPEFNTEGTKVTEKEKSFRKS